MINSKTKLLLVTGLPAAGKDTIIKLFLERNPHYRLIVSHTDRPIRSGETHGVNQHFVSTEEFESLILQNLLLEHVKTGLYYKGTSKKEFEHFFKGKHSAWRVELTRFASFEETISANFDRYESEIIIKNTTKVIIMPESKSIAQKRYSQRDSKSPLEDFEKRWEFEWNFYQKNIDKFPHVVKNPTSRQIRAVEEIEKILGLS